MIVSRAFTTADGLGRGEDRCDSEVLLRGPGGAGAKAAQGDRFSGRGRSDDAGRPAAGRPAQARTRILHMGEKGLDEDDAVFR